MDNYKDIYPQIVSFLKSQTSLSEIGNNYFCPDFREEKTRNDSPRVAIKQVGGNVGYKFMIVVRAGSIQKTRELAYKIVNALSNEFPSIDSKNEMLEGGLHDLIDPTTGYPETFFHFGFDDPMK